MASEPRKLRYFAVDYEVWTRPWFGKGRPKRVTVCFAEYDVVGMLAQSRDHLREFGRRKAKFLDFHEIQNVEKDGRAGPPVTNARSEKA